MHEKQIARLAIKTTITRNDCVLLFTTRKCFIIQLNKRITVGTASLFKVIATSLHSRR